MLLGTAATPTGSSLGTYTITHRGQAPVTVDVRAVRPVGATDGYEGINQALDAVQQLGSQGQTLAIVGDRFSGEPLFVVETSASAIESSTATSTECDAVLRFADSGFDGVSVTAAHAGAILVHDQLAWDPDYGTDELSSLEDMYEI